MIISGDRPGYDLMCCGSIMGPECTEVLPAAAADGIACVAVFVVEPDWWVIARGMIRGERSRLKRASLPVVMAVTTATSALPCRQRPRRFRITRGGRQT